MLYEKAYEDNADGKMTDEWFMELSHKYEVERMELKERISKIRTRLANIETQKISRDMFISSIRKFMQMKTLTAPLVKELIDQIDVYEAESTGKNKTQRIVIYYRFVGYLEMPAVPKNHHYVADVRQGVSVEYLSKKKPA